MGRLLELANMEYEQQFDYALLKKLDRILEFLPNIED
jgi:hypothetical protein